MWVKPICQFKKEKVKASLSVGNIDDGKYVEYFLIGNIPKEYRSGDLIKVRAYFYDIHKDDVQLSIECPIVYKLICIEKMN